MEKLRAFLFISIAFTACVPPPVVTLPPEPSRSSKPIETTLYIPYGLVVQSVDYDVEFYTSSDEGTTYGDGRRGRSFIHVHAVHRNTGEQYLLVYESSPQQPRPIQIFRFEEEL